MRYLLSFPAALLIALILFALMKGLLAQPESLVPSATTHPLSEFIQVTRQDTTSRRERQKPEPPEPEQSTPDMPTLPEMNQAKPQAPSLDFDTPELSLAMTLDTSRIGSPVLPQPSAPVLQPTQPAPAAPEPQPVSVEVVSLAPLRSVPPSYPRRAQRRNIEGWVKLEFTVDAEGRVSDVVVLDAEPEGFFERDAKRAISRWLFKVPKGHQTSRLTQTMEFKLH